MTEKFELFKNICKEVEVVNTDIVGVDHPVVASFYRMLFMVAGRIQPFQESYSSAQKILDTIERKGNPDELDPDDLKTVFDAASATLNRIIIK